jgi:hypothetical protein
MKEGRGRLRKQGVPGKRKSWSRKIKILWPIGRGHALRTLLNPLRIPRWKESFKPPDEGLQNLLKVTKCHGLKPRSTAGKEKYKSRVPSIEASKTSGVESIYICNDLASAKVQEGMEKYIQISKPSYIITTSHYRVPTVVRSISQVQQSRPPEESAPAGALTNGVEGANRRI